MFCYKCGAHVEEHANFCNSCGTELAGERSIHTDASRMKEAEQQPRKVQEQLKETFLHATERVNAMVGEQGAIQVNLKDIFSDVFKKHSKEEAEILFIAGTKITTPAESEITTTWPKPWLFSRIFLVLTISYILLYISAYLFENMNAIPGLIIIGSFVAPFSLLIFFWEMNAPRNISIYETSKMFFIGGTASLVFTLFLYSIFPVYDLDYTGAMIVSIVEEAGKLVAVIYFITKLKPRYILNGLLIGAAIGAGFAAFESAGYAFRFGLAFGDSAMVSVILARSWMSVGTHVVWTAIAGGALVYVMADRRFSKDHIFSQQFLKLFAVAFLLHAVWDMPLYTLQHFNFLFLALIFIAWIFIFSLMNAGLKQITRLNVHTVELQFESQEAASEKVME